MRKGRATLTPLKPGVGDSGDEEGKGNTNPTKTRGGGLRCC